MKQTKHSLKDFELLETRSKNVQTIYFDKNDVMYTQEEV